MGRTFSGASRDRTGDLLLAKQGLYSEKRCDYYWLKSRNKSATHSGATGLTSRNLRGPDSARKTRLRPRRCQTESAQARQLAISCGKSRLKSQGRSTAPPDSGPCDAGQSGLGLTGPPRPGETPLLGGSEEPQRDVGTAVPFTGF